MCEVTKGIFQWQIILFIQENPPVKLFFHCTNFTQPFSTKLIQDSFPWKWYLWCFPPRTSSFSIHVPSFPMYLCILHQARYHGISKLEGIFPVEVTQCTSPTLHFLYIPKLKTWGLHLKNRTINSSIPLKVAHKGVAPIAEKFYVEIKPISLQFFQFVWD